MKFETAKMPAVPFSLQFFDYTIEQTKEQTFLNKATNEQLSISQLDGMIKIKRTRAQFEKEKTSQTVKA